MVRVTVNIDDVMKLLDQVEAAGGEATAPMRDIAHRLRSDILLNFRTGGTYPETWTPSQRVLKHGGQTLVGRAILRNSIHPGWGPRHAEAGTDLIYGGIHQFGGVCGRNHATMMPARPFLPVDSGGRLRPTTERFAADRLLTHIMGRGAA